MLVAAIVAGLATTLLGAGVLGQQHTYRETVSPWLRSLFVLQPDIVYVAPDRLGRASPRGIEGAPTLAVEIFSPSTRTIDRVTKPRLYAHYRVPFLWLIDPDDRIVEAFVLDGDRYVLAGGAAGGSPVELPPFTGLGLVPDTLWP